MDWYVSIKSDDTPCLIHWWGQNNCNIGHIIISEERYVYLQKLEDAGLIPQFKIECQRIWNELIKESME